MQCKRLNVSDLVTAIVMNKSTLYRKLKNNGESIFIKGANGIIDNLCLTVEEINAIFFTHYVAYNATNESQNLRKEVS